MKLIGNGIYDDQDFKFKISNRDILTELLRKREYYINKLFINFKWS